MPKHESTSRGARPRPSSRAVLAPVLAAALALAACGDSGSGSGPGASQAVKELEALGIAKYFGTQEPVRSEVHGAWTAYFYDPAREQATCFDGSPYQVNIHQGTSGRVLLYLEGGGACWDHFTCYVAGIAKSFAGFAGETGIIDLADPRNPFRDDSIVYVPYCDASVFTGDKTVDYEGRRTFHHGRWNLATAIDAIRRDLGSPGEIVVAGSSAGGYGTFAGYGAARVAFPDAKIRWLDDAGPGIQNLEASEDVRNRASNWGFTEIIPPSCTRCTETGQYTWMIDWALERDATLRVGMYSTLQDGVIRSFLGLTGPQYQDLLVGVTDSVVAEQTERFRRYFPQGSSHTILELPTVYTDALEGQRFLDWMGAFLEGDQKAWVDRVER